MEAQNEPIVTIICKKGGSANSRKGGTNPSKSFKGESDNKREKGTLSPEKKGGFMILFMRKERGEKNNVSSITEKETWGGIVGVKTILFSTKRKTKSDFERGKRTKSRGETAIQGKKTHHKSEEESKKKKSFSWRRKKQALIAGRFPIKRKEKSGFSVFRGGSKTKKKRKEFLYICFIREKGRRGNQSPRFGREEKRRSHPFS